jgi:hypothetical protein
MVVVQTAQNMMAVLPHCLRDDDWSVLWNRAKHIDPVSLAINETVSFFDLVGMGSLYLTMETANSRGKCIFHGLLRRPAFLISRRP